MKVGTGLSDCPVLDDWLIVELAGGISAGYCTRLLADAGAVVVKVETGEGDPLRRWTATGHDVPDGEDAALFQFLAATKRSISVDWANPADTAMVDALLSRATAVVWTPEGVPDPNGPFAASALLERHPHLVVSALTPFGLSGPWAARAATEFTAQAWSGGIISWGRGHPDRPPRYVPGRVGEWLQGAYAAFAMLATRFGTGATGPGELIDVPMLLVQVSTLAGYDVLWRDIAGAPRLQTGRFPVFPGVHRTKDGYIGLLCGSGQRWLDFCAMVGHPEWGEDETLFDSKNRADRTSDVIPTIEAWMTARSTDEVRELVSLFRIPVAAILNGETAPRAQHCQARGMFERSANGAFIQPASPFHLGGLTTQPRLVAPAVGEANGEAIRATSTRSNSSSPQRGVRQSPLQLRVLDLTSVWAGPMGTRLLACLGAEVIHVEATSHLDFFRFQSVRAIGDDEWWEWAPNFAGANGNKLGFTLDLQTTEGREIFLRLVEHCDVVVENFTPRVMENLELTYEALREVKPDLIMVRMPGYGLDGPWRDEPAFAATIEDTSGWTWLTGFPEGPPEEPFGLADSNAGIHAMIALLLAVHHRERTGSGLLVEASMIEAAASINAAPVIEYSAYGKLLSRTGNRSITDHLQNLYRTADVDDGGVHDRWVAISVAGDEQWAALCTAIGRPEWVTDPRFGTTEGRIDRQADIDPAIAAWCQERTASEIVDRLWSLGVPVGDAIQPQHACEIHQLVAYGFYEAIDHPLHGRSRYDTPPFRSSRAPKTYNRRPAPTLGQHNHDILRRIGVSAEEIVRLEAKGIIGTTPQPRRQRSVTRS